MYLYIIHIHTQTMQAFLYSFYLYKLVWIVRPRVFQSRTQWPTIRTSISLKWSYQSHRYISYVMPLNMTLFGLKTAMWLIAIFLRYQSTNRRSLCPRLKNPGPYYSHRFYMTRGSLFKYLLLFKTSICLSDLNPFFILRIQST